VTAAETFAEWALALRLEDIPIDVRHAACRHLLDGVGCGVAAHRSGVAPYATALVDGIDEATVIGSGEHASVPRPALANGILVHALDFDDTHAEGLVHSTAAVLPTAFAIGEVTGATGADVLVAAIAGYEVVNRLGAAVTHGFHHRGFHATSVCGVFASALVASRLLGLGAAATVNALGIAGSTAAGSLEFLNTGSATKQLHPGFAAMNGIVAARLAMAGADGPATIFEGEHGLYRSYLGVAVDPAALTDGLGSRWETTRITIKPYPACQLSHASLDAVRAAGVPSAADVDSVRFEIPAEVSSIVAGKPEPRTTYEGKFSLEYCAAVLLIDGELAVGSFDQRSLTRPDVLALASRISSTDRPFAGPPAEAPGICEIRLRDGTVLRGEVDKSRGGPDAPLSDDELLAKFRANGGSDALADALLGLEHQPSIAKMLRDAWPS
jgi:2-methylcitrate dehydratase PrpD